MWSDIPSIGYVHPYTVQTYDIDRDREMTLVALIRQMQEAAMQNVIRLKVSVWDMEEHHFSWVLLRKNLQVERMPKIGEELRFVTYPSGFEKVFTYRDFKVFDATGGLIATSSTTWLLLDVQTRRMVRIPDFVLKFSSEMPVQESCLPRPATKLPSIERIDFQTTFQVRWHDLDFNGHLNNVLYVQWMVETLPNSLLESSTLQDLKIHYKIEGQWKDQIRSEVEQVSEREFLHRLIRISDEKELAMAITTWQ